MPADKTNWSQLNKIWNPIRNLFLEVMKEPKIDKSPLDAIFQKYKLINSNISYNVLKFSIILLQSFWELEPHLIDTFYKITEGTSTLFLTARMREIQGELSKIRTTQIDYSILYEDFINYILILPEDLVISLVTKSASIIDFRKNIKKSSLLQKAQLRGKYYTPDSIAHFIVKNTLQSSKISPNSVILDLCSGTGSFCMNICEYLQQHYQEKQQKDSSLEIKHKIIKYNLRTIDNDPLATFILRFRLVQWFLKGRPTAKQLEEFIEDVVKATKIDNALSNDILFLRKFDIIISNPPYVSEKSNKDFLNSMIKYKNVQFYKARLDFYLHFLVYAFENVKPNGILGFLTPSYFLDVKSGSLIREYMYTNSNHIEFHDFKNQVVFPNAPGFHSCFFIINIDSTMNIREKFITYYNNQSKKHHSIPYSEAFHPDFDYTIKFYYKPELQKVGTSFQKLGLIAEVRQGIIAGPDRIRKKHLNLLPNISHSPSYKLNTGIFVLTGEEVKTLQLNDQEKKYLFPFCFVRELDKDIYLQSENFRPQHYIINLNDTEFNQTDHPTLYAHLSQFKTIMELRRETNLGKRKWFELHWPRITEIFMKPRILAIRRTSAPRFIFTEIPFVTDLATNIITSYKTDIRNLYEYLISAEVTQWITFYAKRKGDILQIDRSVLDKIPVPDNY